MTTDAPFGGVVAIDGPSGTGKSTVSRRLAERIGARFLDTGSMYRAVTFAALQRMDRGAPIDHAVSEVLNGMTLEVGTDPAAPSTRIQGRLVDAEIRTAAVDAAVSAVSAFPEVRRTLISLQRSLIGDGGIVVEGRDITSVVAPDAEVRVLLTASPEARAQRRGRQTNTAADLHVDAMAQRDALDNRTSQFLEAGEGVVLLDTTELTQDQVVDRLVVLVWEAAAARAVNAAG